MEQSGVEEKSGTVMKRVREEEKGGEERNGTVTERGGEWDG